jgi:hypothetical protein
VKSEKKSGLGARFTFHFSLFTPPSDEGRSAIHVPTVPHLHDDHGDIRVVDAVEDAVVSLTKPVLLVTGELHGAGRGGSSARPSILAATRLRSMADRLSSSLTAEDLMRTL